MKTRNQLSNKATPEPNNETNQSEATSSESSNHSPSPIRLRDRQSVSVERKQNSSNVSTPTPHPNQASSPPVPPKQRYSGPTRVLPRRSCVATSLLLSNSNPTVQNLSNRTTKQISTKSSDERQTNSWKDAQNRQQPTSSGQQTNQELALSTGSEMLAVNLKTANTKNYSRDIPLKRSLVPAKPTPKQDNSNSMISNGTVKTKLVKISLPDNTCLRNNNPIESKIDDKQVDKNKYMLTINGFRRIGCESSDRIDLVNGGQFNSSAETSESGNLNRPIQVFSNFKKVFNVLIGVTGSVATIKLIELTKKIKSMFPKTYIDKLTGRNVEANVHIRIVMTQNSKHFAPKSHIQKALDDLKLEIYDDEDEWSLWNNMGDLVLHIELRKWADLCLIAPLDANTMAKLSNGICDNLLTCIVRAWDISKPLVYCPAMNVCMYTHPITREHLSKLQSYGYMRVDCVEKRLACGDVGIGGMASVDTISKKVVECLVEPVSRKLSLTRPLLNQQPTYPIVFTSGDNDNTSSTSAQHAVVPSIRDPIFNRFKANNQISIHAVPNKQSLLRESIESAMVRKKKLKPDGSNNLPKRTDKNHIWPYVLDQPPDNSNNDGNNSFNNNNNNNNNNKTKMGGVTSVQNLRAITAHGADVELEEGSVTEEDGFDIDPTRLLEQSMVTDDSVVVQQDHRHSSSAGQSNSFKRVPAYNEGTLAKVAGLSPLFDTSKFLAVCYNEERGDFTCAICKSNYKNKKSLSRHLKEQHVQGNIFECKSCGVSYKRREKLIKHNRERHPQVSID